MPPHAPIYLFSKTPYEGVEHIPILAVHYLPASIHFPSFDCILLSSKESVNALDKIGAWKIVPVIAISEATAAYAQSKGASILDVANGYGEGLAELFKTKYADLKALYPHAKEPAFDIKAYLAEEGIEIDALALYETCCNENINFDLAAEAVLIFSSPSAVKCFMKNYKFLPAHQIVCIGKTTAAALPEGLAFELSHETSIQSTIVKAKSLL